MKVITNLQVIRRNRHKPAPGDIFAMKLASGRFLFGRIIAVERPVYGGDLVYIYSHQSPAMEVESSVLTLDSLLIPPSYMNRLGFTRGFQVFVRNEPLTDADVFHPNCFFDTVRQRYVDENRKEIPKPERDVSILGVGNYRLMDDEISEALGIVPAGTHVDDPEAHIARARGQQIVDD